MRIWEALKREDEDGATRLVDEYGPRLFPAAVMMCRNRADAEDLVFRTVEKAFFGIEGYSPSGDFFNWLYTIMLNFRRMDLRKRRVCLVAVGMENDLPPYSSRAEMAANRADADFTEVHAALGRLSPLHREVIILKYFKSKRLREIAEILQISEGTVKSRLSNAKSALRVLLAQKKEVC